MCIRRVVYTFVKSMHELHFIYLYLDFIRSFFAFVSLYLKYLCYYSLLYLEYTFVTNSATRVSEKILHKPRPQAWPTMSLQECRSKRLRSVVCRSGLRLECCFFFLIFWGLHVTLDFCGFADWNLRSPGNTTTKESSRHRNQKIYPPFLGGISANSLNASNIAFLNWLQLREGQFKVALMI